MKNILNFSKFRILSFSSEKYLFVHAGIDPKKTIKDQTKKDFHSSRSK